MRSKKRIWYQMKKKKKKKKICPFLTYYGCKINTTKNMSGIFLCKFIFQNTKIIMIFSK